MSDNYLKLTPKEALTIFTSTSEFVYQLQLYCDSDSFFTMPAVYQEITLRGLENHIDMYKKVSMYLETRGVPAMKIFELDTKTTKPKGGI